MIDKWIDLNKKIFKTKNNIKELDIKDKQLEAVKNSLYNILTTNKGELPGEPEFGSNLSRYLFSQLDFATLIMFEEDMKSCIRRWEPRVTITSIDTQMNTDYNELICNLKFIINSDPEEKIFEYRVSFELKK